MEITIETNRSYEAYSKIPGNFIHKANNLPLEFVNYELQPAQKLSNISGLITLAYITAKNYSFYNKSFALGDRKIKAVIQNNKIIPLLRLSEQYEKKISKVWPILV